LSAAHATDTADPPTTGSADFFLHDGQATYLYEVKASISNSSEFDLGASEVRRASRLTPPEAYLIIAEPDMAGYQLVNTQARARFNLD
jgi:hypothetical protein